MRIIRLISVWLLLAGMPVAALCAEAPPAEKAAGEAAAAHEEHGISQKADTVAHIGPLPITNSMIVTWVVTVGLIIFSRRATRNMKNVPDGSQNFWEWMVESLHNFLEGIIGHHLVQRTFWFFAS